MKIEKLINVNIRFNGSVYENQTHADLYSKITDDNQSVSKLSNQINRKNENCEIEENMIADQTIARDASKYSIIRSRERSEYIDQTLTKPFRNNKSIGEEKLKSSSCSDEKFEMEISNHFEGYDNDISENKMLKKQENVQMKHINSNNDSDAFYRHALHNYPSIQVDQSNKSTFYQGRDSVDQ